MRILIACAVLSLVSGCKKSNEMTQDDDGGSSLIVMPVRANDADATATPATSVFEVDERSGQLKSTLILRLDYFPSPEPGKTTLPVCYEQIPADFEVGEAHCLEGINDSAEEIVVPIYARYLSQECYTIPNRKRIDPSEALRLIGCKRGRAIAHALSPQLRMDVEIR